MATNIPDRKNFIQAWVADLSKEVDDCWYRIIPIWFILFFGAAGVAGYFMPASFWVDAQGHLSGSSTSVYSAVLTLNGIIVALSWSAFAKIYEMIGAGHFSKFLQDNDVLEDYLFLVRYIHLAQVLTLIASALALFAAQYPQIPLTWHRALLIALLGFGAYSIRQAAEAVGVMQDLVRYRAMFDAAQSEVPPGKNGLRAV